MARTKSSWSHLAFALLLVAGFGCKSDDEIAATNVAAEFLGSAAAGAYDSAYERAERKHTRSDCGCGDTSGKGCGSRECTPEERIAAHARLGAELSRSCTMLPTLGSREVDRVLVREGAACLGGVEACATVSYVGAAQVDIELNKLGGTWYASHIRSFEPGAECSLSL